MKIVNHKFEMCVVGGGMAGLIAAISAARHGVKVVLVHDRPVLGGNASSEIRMHICGAHGKNMRETGILEEIQLENHYRNPLTNYSIWDSVLWGIAKYQENLTLFLNCSVMDCETENNKIISVTGWQFTSETTHIIEAELFADCSGDGILAPLSGAEFRIGREASSEFSESIAPVDGDTKTMGLTCLFQAREYDKPQPYIAPDWAHKFTSPEDLRKRNTNLRNTNFWWMEVGGEYDSIHDADILHEDLQKIVYGVWDYIKNYAPDREQYANWALDWVGSLPGKRESRRYIGDHILTQNDIESEGHFDDIVAYGGWSMDDHFPAGFYHPEEGTIFHPAPSPFGIPYRTLYSKNVENLFCAGRCHSATHAAMSATRVMATTSLMGQAVGTAAAVAIRNDITPRGVYETKIREVQQILMDDDVYLPWHTREISALSKVAALNGDCSSLDLLRSGIDRPVGNDDNGCRIPIDGHIIYTFNEPLKISSIRLVFDSNLNRYDEVHHPEFMTRNMRHFYNLDAPPWVVPATLIKEFIIETENGNGCWSRAYECTNNYQRLVRINIDIDNVSAVRFIPKATWGSEQAHIYGFEVS